MRQENIALRALTVAVESNTESIKHLGNQMAAGFEMIETKLDAVMGALTDHVNNAHGDQ